MQEVSSSSSRVELDIQLEDILDLREVNMEMEMENTTDPPAGHAKGSAEVNIVDAEVSGDMEIYQVMEDGEYVIYSSLDGKWEREVTDPDSENHLGIDGNIFAQEGDVLEDFPPCRGAGYCGRQRMLSDVRGCERGRPDGTSREGYDQCLRPGRSSKRGGSKRTGCPGHIRYLQRRMLPARIIVDMSGVLGDLYDSYGETTKVNLYSIELVFTEYDQVEEITVPQEVKDAC